MGKKIEIYKKNGKKIFKWDFEGEIPKYNIPENPNRVFIGNPISNVAVLISHFFENQLPDELWINFAKKMSNKCAITGFCRTIQGLSYVIENILKNPNINTLILCGKENGHFVLEGTRLLFKNGILENGEIINLRKTILKSNPNNIVANINISNIPVEIVDLMRKTTIFIDLSGSDSNFSEIEKAVDFAIDNKIHRFKKLELYDRGMLRERPYEVENRTVTISSSKTGISESWISPRIEGESILDAWRNLINCIFYQGIHHMDQYQKFTMELITPIIIINNPLENIDMELEKLGFDLNSLYAYSEDICGRKYLISTERYTYGEKIWKYGRAEEVIKKFSERPETRQAVITLWNPDDDVDKILIGSPTCLTMIQFFLRNKILIVYSYFRSHHVATTDMQGNIEKSLSAWVENMFAIRELGKLILSKLEENFQLKLIIVGGSEHLYFK